MDFTDRTRLLIGDAGIEKLKNSCVAVFGIGGVGSFATEALARAGVGTLVLVDSDKVNVTNINRQSVASFSTIGKYKVDVMKFRLLDINPELRVYAFRQFVLPDNRDDLFVDIAWEIAQDGSDHIDFIADCIDTVSGKLALIEYAKEHGIPVISSMGTGNKLRPEMLELADISETSVCPLSRVMRRELKERGIEGLPVVYSRETPIKQDAPESSDASARPVVGSISFVPSAAGLLLAGEIVRTLLA